MLNLILPADISAQITTSLERAGLNELGGILLAEHVAADEFVVREITVHPRGAFASFVRRIEDAIGKIKAFFQSANHDYRRFNYLGEWHSHPSFEPYPSLKDDASVRDIVQDPKVGANFVALLIVKLGENGSLVATAHAYLPDGAKHWGTVTIQADHCGSIDITA
jgi:[CysO sulfur-carrier protein]-S-L-cysteine hydrolase